MMTSFRRSKVQRLALGLALAIAPMAVFAQEESDYPSRPITILVPFSTGGSVDRMARGLATFLPDELGQPVQVVNRPGASGQVGTTWFLQQPADGYTLMVSPATPYLPTNILVTGADYTLDDFAFINAQWSDHAFLAVPNESPYQTFGELVEAIKANPGKLSVGVTFGSVGHITTMILLDALGLDEDALRVVTFEGGGPLRTALAGGHIDFSIVQAEGSRTIEDMIRPLTVFLEERTETTEDAPLINEALEPYGVTIPVLSGSVRTFVAPAEFRENHPEDYQQLVGAYRRTLESQEFQDWLEASSIGGDWVGPERTTEIIQTNFDALQQYKDLLK